MKKWLHKKWSHFRLAPGDIVISTSASMDKIAEVTTDTIGAIPYTGLIRFKMYGNINKEYFKCFIKSPFYANQIIKQAAGAAIKHYGPSHLRKMYIPLPPLEEQQRIVDKVNALQPLIELYTDAEKRVEQLNNEFPNQLKKAILQEAVQGKLVPQDPNDEPAYILLERIRAEKEQLIKNGKMKRDKKDSIIFRRDNSHYRNLHSKNFLASKVSK